MDDEVQQVYQDSFNQIVFGLSLIGLVGGAIAFVIEGPASSWFLRAIALLVVAIIALILRHIGQFVVAAYVLVLELIGIVAGMLLQANALAGFIPYLFIPIIIIASLILTPNAILALAIFSIAVVLAIMVFTEQFTLLNLLILLPPFGMLILSAILSTLSGHFIVKVNNRRQTSQKLLRQRTLDLLQASAEIKEVKEKLVTLKEQLAQVKAETSQARQAATQKDNRFYHLIKGTTFEIKNTVRKLERVIETIVEKPDTGLLHEAWQSTDHLTSLVVSLEEMAEVESDNVRLNTQTVEVAQLLTEVIQTARGLAREKNLALRCSFAENLPTLTADPARLRQALLHLLSNAVKYTDQGLIEVQTELTGAELIIFISDTGLGLSAEELNTIFQPFSRGQSALAKQRAGTGLGLPLTRRIIEMHGGRLWATSVLGVGSTFCVALPLEVDPEQTMLSLPALTLPAVAAPNRETQPAVTLAALAGNPPGRQTSTQNHHSPQSTAVEPALSQTQANFTPVARFSPVYISRFGLTLLGLLLIITILVIALAVTYGPNKSQAKMASTTPISAAVNPAGNPDVSKTPLPAETATPSSSITASATPSPFPSPMATSLPQKQPEIGQAIFPTHTIAPTRTPTPSPVASATLAPTLTPTQAPTATAPPRLAVPAIAAQGVVTPNQVTLPTEHESSQYPDVTLFGFNLVPGAGLTVITNPNANSGLSWLPSASGYQALFSDEVLNNRDIFLSQRDDLPLNLTPANGDDIQPAGSPDGHHIAFSSGRSGNLDIYVMDVKGGNLVQLTTSHGFDEWPAWSPNGRQLAFVSDRDGNVEIYMMNADGSQQQRLTNDPADDWPVAWSPDGRYVLFASNRDSHWNLYVLELAGRILTRLTNDPSDERDPIWSPDGHTIAFAYYDRDNWNIYAIPAPTGAPAEVPRSQWTQITATSRDERYPMWLP